MRSITTYFYIILCVSLSACSTLEQVQTGTIKAVKNVKNTTVDKVSSVKDNALETVGVKTKHDLLAERVQEIIALQEEAKQHIEVAFDALSNVSGDANAIEIQLDEIADTYESGEGVTQDLKKQIEAVNDIANALFREWRSELRQYTNKNLRKKSAENLSDTKKQYVAVYLSMQTAYKSIEPLLGLMHDNRLYLKHNRTEKALEGFQSEVEAVGNDMASIIKNIEGSIQQSEAFVDVIDIH